MATVALGSQRNQIERTAPPRGLWCDFPLGRPLGRPGDAEFQHRVLHHVFSLLDAPGPVFDVFGEGIADDGDEVIACTLPPRQDPDLHPALDEANGLRPAYDRALARFGNRAGTGRVVDADGLPAAIEAFIRISDGTPWKEAGLPGIPAAWPKTCAATTSSPPSACPTTPLQPGPAPAGSSTTPAPAPSSSRPERRSAIRAPSNQCGSTWPPATADR